MYKLLLLQEEKSEYHVQNGRRNFRVVRPIFLTFIILKDGSRSKNSGGRETHLKLSISIFMQFCAKIELALYVLGVESLVLFLLLKTLKKPNNANLSIILAIYPSCTSQSETICLKWMRFAPRFLCQWFCYNCFWINDKSNLKLEVSVGRFQNEFYYVNVSSFEGVFCL